MKRRERGAFWAACPCCLPDAPALARLVARLVLRLVLRLVAQRLVARARHQKAGRRLWLQPAFFV